MPPGPESPTPYQYALVGVARDNSDQGDAFETEDSLTPAKCALVGIAQSYFS